MTGDIPLLESDHDRPSLIEPAAVVPARDVPAAAVVCFFQDVLTQVAAAPGSRPVATLVAEHGVHPVLELDHHGQRVAAFHPGVGSPIAAAFLEEAIAMGMRSFIAVGGAGALVAELPLGLPVIVDSAVRDEGTSYHYLPPARVVEADPAGVAALRATLTAADADFRQGRTWTTDAIFRETRERVDRRVAEGCLTVEMEAAAFAAVARFRGVRFGQLLYAGDSLAGETWEERSWQSAAEVRRRLFWLAVEASLRLAATP